MTFDIKDIDMLLYSNGKYWLFEHWNEQGTNIYSKAKYSDLPALMKGAGKILSYTQLDALERGEAIRMKQEDGTTLFFKYINQQGVIHELNS